ncbi:hypothetical protein BV22DRAFT_778496 [Leucogyrophana mollusca]|uniref:Uncharacterized protein n=1 Tax=Leucogyrophana mollusca TaxID=85980 RepID=A0ACB8B5T4_9AGAM|nr:hypothetical protein BV22DRAFT_778496 [Leucogyrophana mollusca]
MGVPCSGKARWWPMIVKQLAPGVLTCTVSPGYFSRGLARELVNSSNRARCGSPHDRNMKRQMKIIDHRQVLAMRFDRWPREQQGILPSPTAAPRGEPAGVCHNLPILAHDASVTTTAGDEGNPVLKESELQSSRRGTLCISFSIMLRRLLKHERRLAPGSTSRGTPAGGRRRNAVEECDAVVWGA